MGRAVRNTHVPVRVRGCVLFALLVFVFLNPSAFASTKVLHHKDWQVRMLVDEFTDETQVVLNTKIEENEEDFAGKRGIVLIRADAPRHTSANATDMLVVKCDSPGTPPYVVVVTQKAIDEAGVRNIEFRVDKRDAKKVLMTSHQKYLMIFDRRKARRFIEQVRGGKRLIGRSRPINGKRIEFRIPIDGFDDVEHHLYRYCART